MSTSLLPKQYLPSISALHHAAAKKLLLIPWLTEYRTFLRMGQVDAPKLAVPKHREIRLIDFLRMGEVM